MTRIASLDLLGGANQGVGFAMTWIPAPALRALTWGSGIENEPEALAAVVATLAVDLAFVPAAEPWAAEAVNRLSQEGVVAGWIVAGPLGRVADARGWSSVLALSASGPGELALALDQALHDTLEDTRAGLAAGAEVIMCADELAGAAGWLVSPDFALEALVPCYRRVVAEWVPRGPAVFHSDGDVRALMPTLGAVGFDGVHFGTAGRAGLRALVDAAHSAGLCPLGGLPVQALRASGPHRVGRLAAELASRGRLILADDGGMSSAEEVTALSAAMDSARSSLGIGS